MKNVLEIAAGIALGYGAFRGAEWALKEAVARGKRSEWYIEDQGKDQAKKAKDTAEAAKAAEAKAKTAAEAAAKAAAEAANPTPAT
jgi:hypothetical protein